MKTPEEVLRELWRNYRIDHTGFEFARDVERALDRNGYTIVRKSDEELKRWPGGD